MDDRKEIITESISTQELERRFFEPKSKESGKPPKKKK
jgi:hypothetical protein